MNLQDLESAEGYRMFAQPPGEATWLFQRAVEDEIGIRYYINIFFYDFSRFNHPTGYGITAEIHTKTPYDDTVFFKMSVEDRHVIADVEGFFDQAWAALNCQHYEKRGW
jgi:hypothetical protein